MVFLCLVNIWASQYDDIQLEESEHKSWRFKYTSWAMWSILPRRTTPNFSCCWWTSPSILQLKFEVYFKWYLFFGKDRLMRTKRFLRNGDSEFWFTLLNFCLVPILLNYFGPSHIQNLWISGGNPMA